MVIIDEGEKMRELKKEGQETDQDESRVENGRAKKKS